MIATKYDYNLSKVTLDLLILYIILLPAVSGNADANRLFEDLLADYNKLVRPVDNKSDALVVRFKLKLSQLLDVTWTDNKLKWDPEEYGGVNVLYVPSDMIWIPDIVLYNNADGNYQVSIVTKAKIFPNGTVEWVPPAIYKSMCQINVEWFPFDEQTCEMKFGSWTYGGLEVDLQHKDSEIERKELEVAVGVDGEYVETVWIVDKGIDLSEYYPSVEWDILGVPGKRHKKRYSCCKSPFIDLTYEIHLRRKTLFYTVNLIFPIVGISFLTALVFYLPSDGGEKISLCISILISLTVFFLLLVEIIPPTSLVIPLIGKYLLFTMVLVTLSVTVTVVTLLLMQYKFLPSGTCVKRPPIPVETNVHYRSPTTHTMPKWAKKFFIQYLPKYLCMQRPSLVRNDTKSASIDNLNTKVITRRSRLRVPLTDHKNQEPALTAVLEKPQFRSPTHVSSTSTQYDAQIFGCSRQWNSRSTTMQDAVDDVTFIANHMKENEDDREVTDDWKYISMVMDRIFLILFTTACLLGSVVIILRAPTIYDTAIALA